MSDETEPTMLEAFAEEASMYALRLDTLTFDVATFTGAALTLTMTKGEWVERSRPSQVFVTVLDHHPAQAPPAPL